MAKIRVVIVLVLLIGALSFGIFVAYKDRPNYENKGKKALINGIDTCIIQSEEQQFWMRAKPKRIKVLYKDNYGKYTEQEFQAEMITIINK